MFIKRFFLLLIIVLLFSCADPSIFENNSDDIAVYTVRSGGLQEYGTPLKVTLDYGIESPDFDTLELSLFSDTGILLLKETVNSVEIESRKSNIFQLPADLSRGLYHLNVKILKSGLQVKVEKRSFFYDSDQYRLEGIYSYPPDPVPGEKIIVKADYSSPVDSNPWFRWTVDNKIVSQGFASENGNTAALDKLSFNGVVSATVEMFPYKPVSSGFEDFISFFRTETAIFVSDKNRERNNEFADNRNYAMLFHFRGDIKDEGYISGNYPEKSSVSINGTPDLDFVNSFFGYSFSKDDSLTVNYEINPFTGSPFTFRIRMLPDRTKFENSSSIYFPFFSAADNIDNKIIIGLKEISGFYINIESGSDSYKGECEYIPHNGNEIIDLALNFYNRNNLTDIVWIVNGETVKTDTVHFPVTLQGNGNLECQIGGSEILVDELGLYTTDNEGERSVDSSLYSSIMKNAYNGDFIAADGFDYSYINSVIYESGFLEIEYDSYVPVFKELELFDPVEIKTEGNAYLLIKDSSGEVIIENPVSEAFPVYFDPVSSGEERIFDIYLTNNAKNETVKVDNILITVKYPDGLNIE